MDTEQRLEILCQIIRDYDLMSHIDNNREKYEKKPSIRSFDVGGDIGLLDQIAHGIALYPVQYSAVEFRARQRLGLLEVTEEEPDNGHESD